MLRKIKDRYIRSQVVTILTSKLERRVKEGQLSLLLPVEDYASEVVHKIWDANSFLLSNGLGKRPNVVLVAAYCIACKADESEDLSPEEKVLTSIFSDMYAEIQNHFETKKLSAADLELLSACFEIVGPISQRYDELSFELDINQFSPQF